MNDDSIRMTFDYMTPDELNHFYNVPYAWHKCILRQSTNGHSCVIEIPNFLHSDRWDDIKRLIDGRFAELSIRWDRTQHG